MVLVLFPGQVKGTARNSPLRNFDGSFQPLKIGQDNEFYVKRPASIIHIEILHIRDDEPEGSLLREVLPPTLLSCTPPPSAAEPLAPSGRAPVSAPTPRTRACAGRRGRRGG
jgi:hypothetical protein